mmetsp:Transcript_126921/g.353418  ORF Transcript_126921/g.353418 Transcript_126921/m.353418 type:complete len:346 (-) Transcript_126921:45-1082(-)
MHSVAVHCSDGSKSWRHLRKCLWPSDLSLLEADLGAVAGRYVLRTESVDVIHFPGTSAAPLELNFVDGLGVEHRIKLNGRHGKEKVALGLPLPLDVFRHRFQLCRGITWRGDGVTKKTGVDPRSTTVMCTFAYEPRSMLHTHGIRIRTVSYELEVGEATEKKGSFEDLAACERGYWEATAAQALATVESEDGSHWTYTGLLRRVSEPKQRRSRHSRYSRESADTWPGTLDAPGTSPDKGQECLVHRHSAPGAFDMPLVIITEGNQAPRGDELKLDGASTEASASDEAPSCGLEPLDCKEDGASSPDSQVSTPDTPALGSPFFAQESWSLPSPEFPTPPPSPRSPR